MSELTPAYLLAVVLFSVIGWLAFRAGKREAQWKTMVLGMALMIYPYFVPGAWLVWGVGVLLTAALFVFRD